MPSVLEYSKIYMMLTQTLIQVYAHVTYSLGKDGFYPIHLAIDNLNAVPLIFLLKKFNANLNVLSVSILTDNNSPTSLPEPGYPKKRRSLSRGNAKIELTALHVAIEQRNFDAIAALVKCQANINCIDRY